MADFELGLEDLADQMPSIEAKPPPRQSYDIQVHRLLQVARILLRWD